MKIRVIDFGYDTLPYRAHENDAGADVKVCFHDRSSYCLVPNRTVKVPLGMGLILPDGFAAYVLPRSGLASRGITCEVPPIDSGYRGEIHAIVTNCSNDNYYIDNGDRIGQLVIMPVIIAEYITDDIKQRGDNGFGSTGV